MRRYLNTYFIAITASLCSLAIPHQASATDHLNAAIQAMPDNSWMVVPNSRLNDQNDVEAQGSDFPGIWQGSSRSANGKFPFSGGILDTKRDRMLIWGAGHNDYYGNELYAFNLQDFTWDRKTYSMMAILIADILTTTWITFRGLTACSCHPAERLLVEQVDWTETLGCLTLKPTTLIEPPDGSIGDNQGLIHP